MFDFLRSVFGHEPVVPSELRKENPISTDPLPSNPPPVKPSVVNDRGHAIAFGKPILCHCGEWHRPQTPW